MSIPVRYALCYAVSTFIAAPKPAEACQLQQQGRDYSGQAVSHLLRFSHSGPQPIRDIVSEHQKDDPYGMSRSNQFGSTPQEIPKYSCHKYDLSGNGRIDWYQLWDEAEAATCFKNLAIRSGSAEQFETILRAAGLSVSSSLFPENRTIEGTRIIHDYRDASDFFGSLSSWALETLNPITFLAGKITRGNYYLSIRLTYSADYVFCANECRG